LEPDLMNTETACLTSSLGQDEEEWFDSI